MQVHKSLTLLTMVLLLGFIFVACSNSATSGTPSITTNPVSGGPNTPVVVIGEGFPAKVEVNVRLGPPSVGATPQSYGQAVTDAQGEFTLTFVMPGHWPDGTPITQFDVLVVVLNEDGSAKATAPFSFQPAAVAWPVLSLKPSTGAPGQPVEVTGQGFDPGAQIALRLGVSDAGLNDVNLVQVQTDERGGFKVSLAIPTAWSGFDTPVVEQDLVIGAVDETIGQTLATAPFFNTSSNVLRAVPSSQPETGLVQVHANDTAPAIRFAGWSPDSRWVAYWVSSQQDVDDAWAHFPAGTLHLANVETGESCAVPEFIMRDEPITVHWSDDGAAIILTAEGTFTGRPCQEEPFAALAGHTPQGSPTPDPALSPDGRYRAATALQSSENGILTFETTLAASDETQPLQRVTWQIDERLGDYGLGGEWISRNQFLVYETLTQGPLILDVEGDVRPVLSELLGLQKVPSILDEGGYSLRAIAAPGVEPDAFHLLLTGVGLEGNFPSVILFHAESELVEILPHRYVWWTPFSDDHQWLLMDERSDVGGYESHAISIRRVEDVGGEWRQLASGVDAVLWSADWREMAFSDEEIVTWQTFPDAQIIGRWDAGQFSTRPVAWSPDGRFLVTEGNVPGFWQYGLFVLERPLDVELP